MLDLSRPRSRCRPPAEGMVSRSRQNPLFFHTARLELESLESIAGVPALPPTKAASMTTRYYHTPPEPVSNRVRCPVCHEAVYSRAGIHPQCAVRQADPPRPKDKGKTTEIDGPGDPAGANIVVDPPTAGWTRLDQDQVPSHLRAAHPLLTGKGVACSVFHHTVRAASLIQESGSPVRSGSTPLIAPSKSAPRDRPACVEKPPRSAVILLRFDV